MAVSSLASPIQRTRPKRPRGRSSSKQSEPKHAVPPDCICGAEFEYTAISRPMVDNNGAITVEYHWAPTRASIGNLTSLEDVKDVIIELFGTVGWEREKHKWMRRE